MDWQFTRPFRRTSDFLRNLAKSTSGALLTVCHVEVPSRRKQVVGWLLVHPLVDTPLLPDGHLNFEVLERYALEAVDHGVDRARSATQPRVERRELSQGPAVRGVWTVRNPSDTRYRRHLSYWITSVEFDCTFFLTGVLQSPDERDLERLAADFEKMASTLRVVAV